MDHDAHDNAVTSASTIEPPDDHDPCNSSDPEVEVKVHQGGFISRVVKGIKSLIFPRATRWPLEDPCRWGPGLNTPMATWVVHSLVFRGGDYRASQVEVYGA